MKRSLCLSFLACLLLPPFAHAQGAFLYDQQSSDESNILPGGVFIHENPGQGQTFTPSLNAVGFVRLHIMDNNVQDILGTSIFVHLRSGSVGGPILASTAPVPIPNSFVGTVDFFFASNVSVTAGNPYFFDVLRIGGADSWTANISFYNYPGGTLYAGGVPDVSGREMWFREGIVVPEPGSWAMLLIGIGALVWRRHKSR